jgi:ABC-type amino acid transport substrate-binding protein
VALAAVCLQAGCGLIIDAVQLVQPIAKDEVQKICLRKRVQVGIAVEPSRPFVFPAVFTDEGVRVTGLDVELIRELTDMLSRECGAPVEPVLHLVRFRDLFVLLSEGRLDFFVSSVSANVPSPARSGLAYSAPYFLDGGLAGITRAPSVAERVTSTLGEARGSDSAAVAKALAGLVVAVQNGTTAELYARAVLNESRLLLCDSLPAAFEWQDPPVDVMLGKEPVLRFLVSRVKRDWRLLTRRAGRPLQLSREQYAVVMAEENFRLRFLVNEALFRLEESGRLSEMRRRWFDEPYAYPRRAASEGLPFAAADMPAHYDQGRCRWR